MEIPDEPVIFMKGSNTVVGLGMRSPAWLKEGDVVELRITGLGEQRSVCKNA